MAGERKSMEVILITGRTVYQGTEKERGKLRPDYEEVASSCFMDPEDAKALGIRDGDRVRVTTDFGSLVLTARVVRDGQQKGIIFVPYGPWASILSSHETDGTGMPSLKGLRARIEPAPGERVLSLKELLERFYGPKKPALFEH